MQVLEIPKISNTCAQLINMPIGTRFIVKNDYYGDIYEIADRAQKPKRPIHYCGLRKDEKWGEWIDEAQFCACGECAFHWRYCNDLREIGPLFCRPIDDHGTRKDGKKIYFKIVKKPEQEPLEVITSNTRQQLLFYTGNDK